MKRSPIQEHTSAIIEGFIEETNSLRNLDQKQLKGKLREKFVTEILAKFLTSQFGIGTGIIVNQKGEQSRQIDIIIYDGRILPPFIEKKTGLYPAEHVLAAIEVRSWISKGTIKEYSKAATKLFEEIYDPASSLYQDYDIIQPLHCLAGFYDRGIFRDESREGILQWMMSNAKPLFGVCLVNKFSWLNVVVPEGSLKMADRNNEETKAFIAVLLDNVRTLSQKRYLHFLGVKHIDWLSIYVRDQSGIRRFFKQRNRM